MVRLASSFKPATLACRGRGVPGTVGPEKGSPTMLKRFKAFGFLFLGLALAAAVGGAVMAYSHAGAPSVASANTQTMTDPTYPPAEP